MALRVALAGIVGFLFVTHTALGVPALMGAIMCMGAATANSILVVSFAKEVLLHHGDPMEAAIEAGFTRFQTVLILTGSWKKTVNMPARAMAPAGMTMTWKNRRTAPAVSSAQNNSASVMINVRNNPYDLRSFGREGASK